MSASPVTPNLLSLNRLRLVNAYLDGVSGERDHGEEAEAWNS